MIYESSYDGGRQPFVPDISRGYWSLPVDFVYAALGLSYRLNTHITLMKLKNIVSVTSQLPAFLISLVLFSVPLLVVQSFVGQFSSSGFISAFRLSPIFKGIGYVSLVLNIIVLIYYSMCAMIPLVFLVGSFNPIIPWGCEGTYRELDYCKSLLAGNRSVEHLDYVYYLPSKSYFFDAFKSINIFGTNIYISWQMVKSAIFIWLLIALVIYKLKTIGQMGQIVRYAVRTVIILLLVLIIRLSFMPGGGEILLNIIKPNLEDFVDSLKSIPNYGVSAFGSGWGLTLTLASFNKFNTNIMRSSWQICFGQMLISMLYSTLEIFIKGHLKLLSHNMYHGGLIPFIELYVVGGTVFYSTRWPNLWSILFYFMLFLAGLILMIIHLNVILYSIFDEFVPLRRHKTKISLSLIGVAALPSFYFTSKHAKEYFIFLRFDTFITQAIIDLLVILAVLWIYGRERFQRDIEFMTGERFANWKVFILRFLAPVMLLIALAEGLFILFLFSIFGLTTITIFNLYVRPLAWLCLPAYALYCLLKNKGSFKKRCVKSCRPTDWYPVEMTDRQKYEEVVNNANMTHPLNLLEVDENISELQT